MIEKELNDNEKIDKLKEVSELNDNEFEIAKNRFVDERIESFIDLMSDYVFDKNGKSYHKDLVEASQVKA